MSVIELETTDPRADGVEVSAPIDPAGAAGPLSEIAPDTKVEVRSRFDQRWSAGFAVVGVDEMGYRIRRLSDGTELPTRFSRDEIRRERRRGQWWY